MGLPTELKKGAQSTGFTHQRSKVERYAKAGNFRALSALRKAGRVARIGGTGATTSNLSRLTRYGRRSGGREAAGGQRPTGKRKLRNARAASVMAVLSEGLTHERGAIC